MKVKIIKGTNQIGGCITEISSDKARIIIDFGKDLDEDENESKPCQIDGLTCGDKCKYNAVFITHNHGDHIGFINEIKFDIPIYVERTSWELYKLLAKFNPKIKLPDEKNIKLIDLYYDNDIVKSNDIKIKDINVCAYLTDHSAFNALMFRIENDDCVILHTGDFRKNGYKGDKFIPTLKSIGKVDLLITEGTCFSREDKENETEEQLAYKISELFKYNDKVFVMQATTNIDRITTLYKASKKAKVPMIEDIYMAEIACKAKTTKNSISTIPNPLRHDNLYVFKPYYLWRKFHNDEEFKNTKYMYDFREREIKKDDKIFKDKFIMNVRDSMKQDLKNFDFSNSIFVYSMWDGYIEKERKVKEFCEFMEEKCGKKMIKIHTSGHADLNTVKELIKIVNPKKSIVIHTEDKDILKELTKTHQYIKDGEEIIVNKKGIKVSSNMYDVFKKYFIGNKKYQYNLKNGEQKYVNTDDFIIRYRSDGIKIYFRGQKMFDVYKNNIYLSSSCLNIPSCYFQKESIPLKDMRDNLAIYLKDGYSEIDYRLSSIEFKFSDSLANKSKTKDFILEKEKLVNNKIQEFKTKLEDSQINMNGVIGKFALDLVNELEEKYEELKKIPFVEKIGRKLPDFNKIELNIDYEKIDNNTLKELLILENLIVDNKCLDSVKGAFQRVDAYNMPKSEQDFYDSKNTLIDNSNLFTYKITGYNSCVSIKKLDRKDMNVKYQIENVNNFIKELKKYKSSIKEVNKFKLELITKLSEVLDYLNGDRVEKPSMLKPRKVKNEIKPFLIDEISTSNSEELKELLGFEFLLFKCTVNKDPFKKFSLEKSVIVNNDKLESFDNLINGVLESIKYYNDSYDKQHEKMFQDLLMREKSAKKIGNSLGIDLMPLEEEFVMNIPEKLNKKLNIEFKNNYNIKNIKDIEDDDIITEEENNDKKNLGRIDNVYVHNNELVLVEVKIDDKVIEYEKNGILKHLVDLIKWSKKENEETRNYNLKSILNGVEERKKYDNNKFEIGLKDINNKDLISHYYILCGYEDEEMRDSIIKKIIDEKDKIDEMIRVLKNDNSLAYSIDTEIYLIKTKREDQEYIEISNIEPLNKYLN